MYCHVCFRDQVIDLKDDAAKDSNHNFYQYINWSLT